MLARLFARRYFFSPHSRSVVNLISGVSVAAVAMPVAAMIILLSVFNGFESLVRSMYSLFDADLTITPRTGRTFEAAALDTAALRRLPGVEGLAFQLEQSVLLEAGDRQATTTLRGVDEGYATLFPLDGAIVAGSGSTGAGDAGRLIMGQSMAWALGIHALAGADVAVYAVRRGSFSTLLPLDNYTRRTAPVGGIYLLDLDSERTYVLSSLRLAQDLFGYPDRASSLLLRVAPGSDAREVRRAVSAAVGEEFTVRTRDELRASYYRIMTYEKWGIFFIALLVLLVASFSVVGALSMLIVEKRDDITTLRALGADTGFVRAVFRTEGYLICTLGGAIGLLLGVGLSLVQQHFGLIEIPAETFLTKSYPVEFRLADLFAVVAAFSAIAVFLSHVTVRSMIKNPARK